MWIERVQMDIYHIKTIKEETRMEQVNIHVKKVENFGELESQVDKEQLIYVMICRIPF